MAIIINCNKSLVLRLTWREDKVPTNDKKEGKSLLLVIRYRLQSREKSR